VKRPLCLVVVSDITVKNSRPKRLTLINTRWSLRGLCLLLPVCHCIWAVERLSPLSCQHPASESSILDKPRPIFSRRRSLGRAKQIRKNSAQERSRFSGSEVLPQIYGFWGPPAADRYKGSHGQTSQSNLTMLLESKRNSSLSQVVGSMSCQSIVARLTQSPKSPPNEPLSRALNI